MPVTGYSSGAIACLIYGSASGMAYNAYAAQVAFSHWWLARFRYGPMEWLWRGFTYSQVPPLRIGDAPATAPIRAA
jgi:uncharacterized membrane protein YeiB